MDKQLRVLIVDYSEDDAQLLVRVLQNGGYDPAHEIVGTEAAMKASLDNRPWHIVFSKYALPQFSADSALALCRKTNLDLPFMIISDTTDEYTAAQAMKPAANDYFLKGFLNRLVPAVKRELQEAEERRRRKDAEEALAKSEQRYKRLVAAVTDYIYTVRIEVERKNETSHGPGCETVTGYTAEEYQANPNLWYEMILEEDRPRVMERINDLLEGRDVPSLEHRIRHKDGSIRWVKNTVVPRHNEQGSLIGYDGLISDITVRKQAETYLRLQSAALESAANAIVITDRAGDIIWVNPAFTVLTGYAQDEVVHRNLSFLKSGRHGEAYYRDLWATINAGRVWHGEITNRRKDGYCYTEEQTITPVMDERGEINHFVAIKQDITERKLAEKALLENIQMMREMEIAKKIQLSLLPASAPMLHGVQCAGRCVQATHVGGDYYDFFNHGENSVDMVIADVSGHSVGAALIMAETRSALRVQVHAGNSTTEILTALNKLLYDDLSKAELFISMFYVKYNPNKRLLTYSNAGHNHPLLFRPSDMSFTELDAEGLILGVQLDVDFEEKHIHLGKGDLLVLYTDGIVEAMNENGDFFGSDRLCHILAEKHNESPEAVVNAVLEEIDRFTGSTAFQDDISLVILKAV
jgi:sigma-B regulation protein RsbU (phosphoserine phosphatase)